MAAPGDSEPRDDFVVDTRSWPYARIVAYGNVGDADLDPHFEDFLGLFARSEPFTILYDASRVKFADVRVRRAYARFIQQNAAAFRARCLGVGFVITSPLVRGALTTVFWITAMPCPYEIFATEADADAWCRARF